MTWIAWYVKEVEEQALPIVTEGGGRNDSWDRGGVGGKWPVYKYKSQQDWLRYYFPQDGTTHGYPAQKVTGHKKQLSTNRAYVQREAELDIHMAAYATDNIHRKG